MVMIRKPPAPVPKLVVVPENERLERLPLLADIFRLP